MTTVAVDLLLFFTLPDDLRGYGLAAGQASSYLVGVWVCTRVLARRVPRDPEGRVLRTTARSLTAVLPPAVLALSLVVLLQALLGQGPLGAGVASVAGGGLLLGGYVLLARRLGVPEVDELVRPVLSKITVSAARLKERPPTGRTPKGDHPCVDRRCRRRPHRAGLAHQARARAGAPRAGRVRRDRAGSRRR